MKGLMAAALNTRLPDPSATGHKPLPDTGANTRPGNVRIHFKLVRTGKTTARR